MAARELTPAQLGARDGSGSTLGNSEDGRLAEDDRAAWRRRSDAEICQEKLLHDAEQQRFRALARDMTPREAQLVLQRRGRIVYRASVSGGRRDRWFVSGLGSDVTDAQLVEEAERLSERQAA